MDSTLVFARNTVKKGIWAACIIGFFINLLMLVTPLYMLQIYDRVLTSQSVDTLLFLSIFALGAIVIWGILEAIRMRLLKTLGEWLVDSFSGHALKQSIFFGLNSGQTSSIQSNRDIDTLKNFLGSHSLTSLIDSPWACIYLVAIFFLHPVLGWIALTGGAFLLLLALINDRILTISQHESGPLKIAAMNQAEMAIRNSDLISAMGLSDRVVNRFQSAASKATNIQSPVDNNSGLIAAISKTSRMSIQVLIMGAGAWLTIGGELTAGGIIAASILVGRALAPVDQSITSWRMAAQAKEALFRLEEHFSGYDLQEKTMSLPEPKGDICVEQVDFNYSDQEQACIKGVSFSLNAGESLAIIGPSGAGKSTLARLLLGNLKPNSGHVRLDGLDISEWGDEEKSKFIGYLPQGIELFTGTIKDNIAKLAPGKPEDVIEAAELAHAHDLIMHQPQGYETHIGPNGAKLSSGQRQRIALARALYQKPSVVVLDEPNANLDSAGEQALLQALLALKQGCITTIVISHHTNILKQMDKILILQDGELKAFGTEEELMKPHKPVRKEAKGSVILSKREGRNNASI